MQITAIINARPSREDQARNPGEWIVSCISRVVFTLRNRETTRVSQPTAGSSLENARSSERLDRSPSRVTSRASGKSAKRNPSQTRKPGVCEILSRYEFGMDIPPEFLFEFTRARRIAAMRFPLSQDIGVAISATNARTSGKRKPFL